MSLGIGLTLPGIFVLVSCVLLAAARQSNTESSGGNSLLHINTLVIFVLCLVTLALGHLLLCDFLPLFSVNTLSLPIQMFSVLLNHSGNALEQTEDTTDGCCVNMLLHMTEQRCGMLVAMLCGNTQPFHALIQASLGSTE